MPKAEKPKRKTGQELRHDPLEKSIQKPNGKLKAPKSYVDDGEDEDSSEIPQVLKQKLYESAKKQREEEDYMSDMEDIEDDVNITNRKFDSDNEYDDDSVEEDDEAEILVDVDGDYVDGLDLSAAEEAVVSKFLNINRNESRTLADIILEKIRQKEEGIAANDNMSVYSSAQTALPPKVIEVYSSVGKLLAHYTAGKLPKALKMLPHLRNWEDVLWITRPDEWSPIATYACTRIFASNLNARMAQRFFNVVLLEKCRDDIRRHKKLNYHLYMALKKGLYKPAAFYKGILLPLALSRTCTLREATIIGSVISKVSVPPNHSAAVLLKLAEMPYSGSTSLFIKVLVNKRYALPRRVIDALHQHFTKFVGESRTLPVIWHQALLAFVQRYKFELSQGQKDELRKLVKLHPHHQISAEVRRELLVSNTVFHEGAGGADKSSDSQRNDEDME